MMDTDADMMEHTAVTAISAQKRTTRGANVIMESSQQRSAAVVKSTASVSPQKNNQTHDNQTKKRNSDSVKK